MTQSLEAVYENGAFRPVHPESLAISDGQRVRITVDDQAEPEALRLAACVYEGLSEKEIAEVEEIALDRQRFFGTRNAP